MLVLKYSKKDALVHFYVKEKTTEWELFISTESFGRNIFKYAGKFLRSVFVN